MMISINVIKIENQTYKSICFKNFKLLSLELILFLLEIIEQPSIPIGYVKSTSFIRFNVISNGPGEMSAIC